MDITGVAIDITPLFISKSNCKLTIKVTSIILFRQRYCRPILFEIVKDQ